MSTLFGNFPLPLGPLVNGAAHVGHGGLQGHEAPADFTFLPLLIVSHAVLAGFHAKESHPARGHRWILQQSLCGVFDGSPKGLPATFCGICTVVGQFFHFAPVVCGMYLCLPPLAALKPWEISQIQPSPETCPQCGNASSHRA